jgi:HD-GYP domain-containing protein (c-di-GMP phosphodiesterase class II)
VSELRLFAPAVRSHHERFDGKGYPDGLERASIPFAARIVAVADAFNAMIARRPYRAPLPPTHAIQELKRNSGTQWDPAAVQAMIDVVLSGR